MSRVCCISLKRPQFGNNVSHANNKRRRIFRPNLHQVTLYSHALSRPISLKISSAGLRTIDKYGGLDGFLEKTPSRKLHGILLSLKRRLTKAQATD